ncbi:trigger factor-related chaperone [Mycoplasma sp. OR1901]|uniref:trigger factor-related chaperone n=1 Tax=Mycoplasma sp. OR1901 TaxID=2742195 RepID=UPI001581F533|nr:hypothetical protein [Mycoplasma sp. OR1901]QKT05154.1 hypothetical protein HTZ87_00265 [Mycoplasma sp. OR1901]
MKSITRKVTLEKEFWINVQNQALHYLESKKEKGINQAKILDESTRTIIFFEKMKLHEELLSKYDDPNVYLAPILINKDITVEKAGLEFKVFYITEEEYNDFASDLTNRPDFKLPENYDAQINTFVDNYVQNFSFKNDIKGEIKLNNEVGLEIYKADINRKDRIVLIANNNDQKSLEYALIGKKVGDKFTYKFTEEETYEIHILNAKEVVKTPLSDDNVNQLQIPEIKNLDDAKKYVYGTIKSGMVDESLVTYGFQIVDQVSKLNLKKFNFPIELLEDKISEIDPQKIANLKPEEVASTIYERFVAQWILIKRFKLNASQTDMNEEINKINASMTPAEASRISIRKVIDIILIKKIGLVYLQKYEPNTYKQNFETK